MSPQAPARNTRSALGGADVIERIRLPSRGAQRAGGSRLWIEVEMTRSAKAIGDLCRPNRRRGVPGSIVSLRGFMPLSQGTETLPGVQNDVRRRKP